MSKVSNKTTVYSSPEELSLAIKEPALYHVIYAVVRAARAALSNPWVFLKTVPAVADMALRLQMRDTEIHKYFTEKKIYEVRVEIEYWLNDVLAIKELGDLRMLFRDKDISFPKAIIWTLTQEDSNSCLKTLEGVTSGRLPMPTWLLRRMTGEDIPTSIYDTRADHVRIIRERERLHLIPEFIFQAASILAKRPEEKMIRQAANFFEVAREVSLEMSDQDEETLEAIALRLVNTERSKISSLPAIVEEISHHCHVRVEVIDLVFWALTQDDPEVILQTLFQAVVREEGISEDLVMRMMGHLAP